MVDLLVLVVQGLVRAPSVFAGRRKLKAGNGRGGQVPEPDPLALCGKFAGAHQQERDRSQDPSHHIILPSGTLASRAFVSGTVAAVIALSDGRDSLPCRNFLRGRGQLERSTWRKRGRLRRNRCR